MAGITGLTSIKGSTGLDCCPSAADQETWTLVVIPDTQRLAPNNATAYNSLIQWIVDNKTTEDIQMVMHVGDLVNLGSSSAEWNVAETAMDRLHDAYAVRHPQLAVVGRRGHLAASGNGSQFRGGFGVGDSADCGNRGYWIPRTARPAVAAKR